MALTLEVSARNAAVNAVTGLINAGTSPGALLIKSAEGTVLCAIPLGTPAFAPAVDGVAKASNLPLIGVGTAAAGDGTRAAKYTVVDGGGNAVWSGTVPGNLALDNASIAANQVVSIAAWSHGQPAS